MRRSRSSFSTLVTCVASWRLVCASAEIASPVNRDGHVFGQERCFGDAIRYAALHAIIPVGGDKLHRFSFACRLSDIVEHGRRPSAVDGNQPQVSPAFHGPRDQGDTGFSDGVPRWSASRASASSFGSTSMT